MREVLNECDATKAVLALAQKPLEKVIAANQKEPPQKRERGKGKSHRETVRAKDQRVDEKAVKQAKAEATERASTDRAEAQREAERALKHEAAKQEAAEAH